MKQKAQSVQIKFLIKLIQSSKFIILENMRVFFLFLIIPINVLFSQLRLPVNDSVQNFLFAKSSSNDPILITVNGIFQYKSDWSYLPFNNSSFKKKITEIDELNHANFFTKLIKNELYIISNGAGPVFKLDQNSFIRIDNSSLHKNQFGGELKTFVSGGGALDREVGIFLNAIGLPTLQGYGLTETSPVVSCNPFDDIRVETVGPPFKGNEVKIASDGEILVKGENVMLGYWNNEEETEKVLKDGWLHTGDIGIFDNGYLKITDRKKDILITPGGDNISPVKIENELSNSKLIDQSVVYGDNKPYLVALLVLSEENIDASNDQIQKEIENINKNLSRIENIKKFFIINEKFSIENGMLTPTLKPKRYKIIQKYKNEFEKLY